MKIIATDIDGVLTDGCVLMDVHGNEMKKICYRDLDAIGIGRRAGFSFAFVTGESGEMADMLAKRFGVEMIVPGAKDKLAALTAIAENAGINLRELIYIGDSDRDVPALEVVGLAIAPRDATEKARKAAHVITDAAGGQGVLLEVVNKLISDMLYINERG